MTDQPTLGEPMRQVSITTDGAAAQVVVNGTDISPLLQGYTLEQGVGQAPRLVLYTQPHKQGMVFEGMAHVAVGTEQDPGETIAAFLANIDPKALEQAALNRDDLGGERYDLTRAMLAQLTDVALGRR